MKFSKILFCIMLFASLGKINLLAQGNLFVEVESLQKKADSLNAVILSPENYVRGIEALNEAKKDWNNRNSLEEIKDGLANSRLFLSKAIKNAEIVTKTFAVLLKAREDCKVVMAETEAKDTWREAEKLFSSAMKEFESDDIEDAKEYAVESEKYFLEAELIAIKNKNLSEARELLKAAENSDVRKNVPITFANAQLYLQQADESLTNKRYDNQDAAKLITQSIYAAKHAMYIDKLIRENTDNDKTWEYLILESEVPLDSLAKEFGLEVWFDEGYNDAVNKIKNYVSEKNVTIDSQEKQIAGLNSQIKDLQTLNDTLKAALETTQENKSILQKKINEIEQAKKEYQEVIDMFGINEAEILRDGNNIVVRLTSLNFDAGKSVIDPKYFSLLSKVQKAIEKYKDCTVSVEGHTDSQGSEKQNEQLSRDRAEAVRQYLMANMDLPANKILSIGYGESKPIANNELEDGRRKNRRIDVVITPL